MHVDQDDNRPPSRLRRAHRRWGDLGPHGAALQAGAGLARRHLADDGALRAGRAGAGGAHAAPPGFGGVLLLQNLGMERTSVSHAALIVGAVPALVAVATAAAGRAASGPVAWAGFATALAGVVVVAGAGGDAS